MHDPFKLGLGIETVAVEEGRVVMRMTIRPAHLNQHATAHGGVLFSLADAAFAETSNLPGIPAVALDTSMTFMQAVRVGDSIYAECREESRRRRVGVYTVRITQEDLSGPLVALFRGTVFRIPPEASERTPEGS